MVDTTDNRTPWTRSMVDQLDGVVLLEFGASWCSWCAQARPWVAAALSRHPAVRHIRIEDGRGEPLGRSFGVRLWPTFVLLRSGVEVERLVRPSGQSGIQQALNRLATP